MKISIIHFDCFPIGLLITTGIADSTKLTSLHVNPFMCDLLGFKAKEMVGKEINLIFTKASLGIIETYLIPLLIKNGKVLETQLTLRTIANKKLPVLVNVSLNNVDEERLYWSLVPDVKHNKLYQGLISARRVIEQKSQELEHLALKDSLTNLMNRREWNNRLEHLLMVNEKVPGLMSVAMIDIDHFKRINDTYGHDVGDEVLVGLSDLISRSFREVDYCARLGGEEFAVCLRDMPTDLANEIMNRFQHEVEALSMPLKNDQVIKFTVSIGITQYQVADTLKTIMKRADKAMYKAKGAGRNCIFYA